MTALAKRPNRSTPPSRPISILDQDEDRVPIPDQYLLTLHTLADLRKFLKGVPREEREEAKWQHVEASLRESPEDAAVALKLALMLDHVPYSAENYLKARKK
jgi:hypothetical protein